MPAAVVDLIIALAAFCTGYGLGVFHNAVTATRTRVDRDDDPGTL